MVPISFDLGWFKAFKTPSKSIKYDPQQKKGWFLYTLNYIQQGPQVFNFLKNRWVLGGIAPTSPLRHRLASLPHLQTVPGVE